MFVGKQGFCAWFLFLFWIYLRGNTRRSCLPLFSVSELFLVGTQRRSCLPYFSYWFDLRYMTFSSDRSLLAHVTGVSTLLQQFGWDDQSCYYLVSVSYRCTVSTRSCRWWSLYLAYMPYRSRFIFLLNFGISSLLFTVNDTSDKPSKCLHSLYVVGRTWEKLKSV